MTKRQYILFIIPTLIWGSTWFAIKFQVATIDPLLSVAYRFILAGIILMCICFLSKKRMKFNLREHILMFLLGLSLFGINYWFVYTVEKTLSSGLVAVIFSMVIFFTIFFNAVLLKGKIKRDVIIGAILGVTGTTLLYKNDISSTANLSDNILILALSLAGIIIASLGNILSAYNQKQNIPVIQSNAYAMIYGGMSMLLLALITQRPIEFDTSTNYLISILYLAIFGSVVAFTAYLKLLGEIGPDRSIYIALITPAIALVIMTIFEDYRWNLNAFVGVIFLIIGNVFVLKFKRKQIKNETI